MLTQKNIKRIICIIVILITSILIFHAAGSLWEAVAVYETVINNELLIVMPSTIRAGEVYAPKEKTFKSESGDNSYSYPIFFSLEDEKFENGKILYHIVLVHKNPSVQGFIQVWDISEPMELMLSKYIITSDISDFKESRININNSWGIQWDYTITIAGSGEKYKSRQVFLDRGDKMYIVSLFSPEDIWKKNKCDKLFETLSHSLRLLK